MGGGFQPWVRVILDTDMATDPGDAGALNQLHTLAQMGYAQILGVMCCGTYNYAPGCVDAINIYRGRSAIPVGVNKGPTLEPGPDPEVYNKYITQNFPNRYPNAASAPNAVTLYRSILAAAPNSSVVICCGGQLANIAHLLDSPADSISALNGSQLLAQKCLKIISMAGDYPNGNEYNIYTDWTSAKNVCDNFSGRLEFLGYTPGLTVKTGQQVINIGNTNNPTYWAFKLFKDVNPTLVPRESWDQMAVWLAILGLTFNATTWFSQVNDGSNRVDSDGTNHWVNPPLKNQVYTNLVGNAAQMAALIDQWQSL